MVGDFFWWGDGIIPDQRRHDPLELFPRIRRGGGGIRRTDVVLILIIILLLLLHRESLNRCQFALGGYHYGLWTTLVVVIVFGDRSGGGGEKG